MQPNQKLSSFSDWSPWTCSQPFQKKANAVLIKRLLSCTLCIWVFYECVLYVFLYIYNFYRKWRKLKFLISWFSGVFSLLSFRFYTEKKRIKVMRNLRYSCIGKWESNLQFHVNSFIEVCCVCMCVSGIHICAYKFYHCPSSWKILYTTHWVLTGGVQHSKQNSFFTMSSAFLISSKTQVQSGVEFTLRKLLKMVRYFGTSGDQAPSYTSDHFYGGQPID